MKEPPRNISRAADLPPFENDSSNSSGSLVLLLEELVQLVLRPVEPERLKRAELRTQLECILGEERKVGVQACYMPTLVNDLVEPHQCTDSAPFMAGSIMFWRAAIWLGKCPII